jgi:hypothetical protein
MADVGIVEKERDRLIAEIRSLQDELEKREVKRERIKLYDLDEAGLEKELNSLREQLKRRKEFLGEK